MHSRHLHAPLRGRFGPNSLAVAHYAALIRTKSPTNCDVHLTESNFQTRSRAKADWRQSGPVPWRRFINGSSDAGERMDGIK
ncbi:DUF6783 domain-containing protein [[Clostridium] symbiosum]|uniref:DUF6783 domain-containing protein n=1 Tax=Clostridium symbiosum TaxID=1512 RepID=UPI003A7F52D2